MKKGSDDIRQICGDILDNADLGYMAGVTAGIMKGGEYVTGARGFRNSVRGIKMQDDDIFHCASVSKTFTSSGIMKLREQGKLSLDDRLADILPYLSIADKRYEKIQIQHMISHISGLPDYEEINWDPLQTDTGALRRNALSDTVSDTVLCSDPDDGAFMYSDMAYDLLGLVIQEVSGISYEDFMKENFIKPAGMDDTTFITTDRTGGGVSLEEIDRAGMAMPHVRHFTGRMQLEGLYPYSRQHAPSSTLTSNVRDLLRWGRYNLDRRSVSESSYDLMWTPRLYAEDKGAYMGMGWFILDPDGRRVIGHGGGDTGFRSSFRICPDLDIVMVILANTTEAPIEDIETDLFADVVRTFG